jgi:hypothetical protein
MNRLEQRSRAASRGLRLALASALLAAGAVHASQLLGAGIGAVSTASPRVSTVDTQAVVARLKSDAAKKDAARAAGRVASAVRR